MLSEESIDDISEKVTCIDLSQNESGSPFPILDLPKKARDHVLDHLSVWKLMDIRLVCKATKLWVDEDHMKRFVLYIKNYGQMEDITVNSASVAWSNIVMQVDANVHDLNWIQNPLYSTLLQKLSSSLNTLQLDNHRLPQTGLISILSTCQVLKSLTIGTLDCKEWTDMSTYFSDDETISRNLHKIEYLSIGYLSWNEEKDLDLFKSTLHRCSNLKHLKAPHILMANLFHVGDVDEEEIDKKYLELVNRQLVSPIKEFLDLRNNNGENNLKILDVENLHHSEIFPLLLPACYKTQTQLRNVSEAYDDSVPATNQQNFLNAIESLNGFTSFMDFHKLVNLKSITLDSETSADSEVNKESVNATLPALKSISMCLPEDIDKSILNCLFKQKRQNVISLSIEFQTTEDAKLFLLFKPLDIVTSYENLQKLALLEFNGKDDDLIILINGLTRLKNLRVQGCDRITDRGFLGEDPANPVLLKLKDLQELWMDCQISNAVFKYAIRHLKLEVFYYFSQRITVPGFLSLTQGPLTSTLIVFPVKEPENCSEEILEKFMRCFKNIKRGPMSFCFKCLVHVSKCICQP